MARTEKQISNLRPIKTLTKEEAKKRGSIGGKNSVLARRERKTQKEQLELLMSLPLKDIEINGRKVKNEALGLGISECELDNQMAMNVAMYRLILSGGKGAVQAYNSIIDILGDTEKYQLQLEKAKQEIELLKLEREKLKRDLGNGNEGVNEILQGVVSAMSNIRTRKEEDNEEKEC